MSLLEPCCTYHVNSPSINHAGYRDNGDSHLFSFDVTRCNRWLSPLTPSGIPLNGFSPYHDQVFDFLKNKGRYLKHIR